jgi:ABC-type multidrug transport system fused ATPase/permease subunit
MQTYLTDVAGSSSVNGSFMTASSGENYANLFYSSFVSDTFSRIMFGDTSSGTLFGLNTFPTIQATEASPAISTTPFPVEIKNRSLGFYLAGYAIISLISTIIDVGRYYVVFQGSLRASRKVSRELTYKVLRTPLRWLDTVPTGRILNRFTADFQALDSQLSSNFAQVASAFLSIFGILVAAFLVSPYIILLALVNLTLCGRVALRYIRGARSIKRLESIQKSPMISHFTATLQGLSTIRAFGNTEVFEKRMNDLTNSFAAAFWHTCLLIIRLDITCP